MVDLYKKAAESGAAIEYVSLPANKSMSVSSQGGDFVLMDQSLIFSESAERVHLAHELGHCVTGSFYSPYSPLDLRSKHEYRANKWAVHALIPLDNLRRLLKKGITEVQEIAERFNVTEEFVHKALYIYRCEGKLK